MLNYQFEFLVLFEVSSVEDSFTPLGLLLVICFGTKYIPRRAHDFQIIGVENMGKN